MGEVTRTPEETSKHFFLGAINSGDSEEEPWSVMVHINQKPVQFKIDTGADICVMSESTYQALPKCPQLQPSNAILSSPGGKLNCKGKFTANIALKENTNCEDIYIIEGPCVNNLLSRRCLRRHWPHGL